MDRIRKILATKPFGADKGLALLGKLALWAERDLIPLVNQLREAVNYRAPSGTFTISGTDTAAVVTFDTAEPDTDYHVLATTESYSGAVGYPSFCVKNVAKTTAGFTLTLVAAPGGGKSVTMYWQLSR